MKRSALGKSVHSLLGREFEAAELVVIVMIKLITLQCSSVLLTPSGWKRRLVELIWGKRFQSD